MTSTTTGGPLADRSAGRPATNAALGAPGFAAALCLVVVVVHLEDQDWLSFAKEPGYLQVGYGLVEVAGLLAAAMLLTRPALGSSPSVSGSVR
jgi:hypothetical protein